MKKWIGMMILLLLAASGVFFYLSLADSALEGQGIREESVVLRYTGWGTELEKKATERLIEQFESKHPGIRVEYTHIPDDYDLKIEKMAAEGKEPDVAMVGGLKAMKLADDGKLKNILELAEADSDAGASLDNILPQAIYWWEEGKACGVNSALEVDCLVYNKKLTQEAGVQVPSQLEDAWDWEEFVEAAQKLTIDEQGRNALDPQFDPQHIRRYGVKIELADANLVSHMYAFSQEDFLDASGKRVNLKGTKALEGIQKMADLINVYHVAPDPLEAKNLPFGAPAMEAEAAAMIWGGQWILMNLAETGVDFGIGVLPAMFGRSATISLGEPIVVFNSTSHPKEAWEFAKTFMDPAYTLEMMESGLWMPVLKSWYEDLDLLSQWASENPAHPPEYQDAVITPAFQSCQPNWGYTVKNYERMMDILSPLLNQVWLGEITAAEAADFASDGMDQLAEGTYPRP